MERSPIIGNAEKTLQFFGKDGLLKCSLGYVACSTKRNGLPLTWSALVSGFVCTDGPRLGRTRVLDVILGYGSEEWFITVPPRSPWISNSRPCGH